MPSNERSLQLALVNANNVDVIQMWTHSFKCVNSSNENRLAGHSTPQADRGRSILKFRTARTRTSWMSFDWASSSPSTVCTPHGAGRLTVFQCRSEAANWPTSRQRSSVIFWMLLMLDLRDLFEILKFMIAVWRILWVCPASAVLRTRSPRQPSGRH